MQDGKGVGRQPALAWLAALAGAVAVSWPFLAGPAFRQPRFLFLFLFLGWAVMILGLVFWGRALARGALDEDEDQDLGHDEGGPDV